MIITGMAHFESVCKNKLVEWYNHNSKEQITLENVFVVWAMAFTLNIPTTATNKKCTKTYTRRRPIAASERKINHDWRFI